jgi:hypothetical protein
VPTNIDFVKKTAAEKAIRSLPPWLVGYGAQRGKGGNMIIQMIFLILLAVLGCAGFAALGIWAAITDEGHTAQRRRASEMRAIPVPSQKAEETEVLLVRMGLR